MQSPPTLRGQRQHVPRQCRWQQQPQQQHHNRVGVGVRVRVLPWSRTSHQQKGPGSAGTVRQQLPEI